MSDNAPRPNPQEMLARLEQMERNAEQLLARYEALQAETGSEAVEVYSEDGLIRVKLDREGQVDEVELHPHAMQYSRALGEHIRHTLEQARATHTERAAQIAQQLLGDKIDVQAILNQYRSGNRP